MSEETLVFLFICWVHQDVIDIGGGKGQTMQHLVHMALNELGALDSSNGIQRNWYNLRPGPGQKAVFIWSTGCQYPLLRSKVEKIMDCAIYIADPRLHLATVMNIHSLLSACWALHTFIAHSTFYVHTLLVPSKGCYFLQWCLGQTSLPAASVLPVEIRLECVWVAPWLDFLC